MEKATLDAFAPLIAFAGAWLLDALIGDPPKFARFHPIVWIGNLVALSVKLLYSEKAAPTGKFLRGAALWVFVLATVVAATVGVQALAALGGATTLIAAQTLIGWATIATRDLGRQAGGVGRLVEAGKLGEARLALSMIVGRDTEKLPEGEICRAAFETAAENSSDGVVAPILFLAMGFALGVGPTLAVAYKAVNTLDSMVGYKNERYLFFGRFSARCDDVANYLPARITALFAALAGALLFRSGFNALRIAFRDHANHSSPNSGWPEAAFAGAARVRIGGTNYYGGVPRASHAIGDPQEPLDPSAVRRAVALVWAVSALAFLTGSAIVLTLARTPL